MHECPKCGEKHIFKVKCRKCGYDLKNEGGDGETIIEVQPEIVHSQAPETKKSGVFGKIFGDFADGIMGTDYDETVLKNDGNRKIIEIKNVEVIKKQDGK